MEHKSNRVKAIKVLLFLSIVILFQSCCWFDSDCNECFDDPNLFFPELITNIPEITRTTRPTFIGQQFYPQGVIVGVPNGVYVFNEFFSVTRFIPEIGQNTTFFWNRDTPPNFTNLIEGETITYYKLVANLRPDNNLECLFTEAREITSVLDVRVRANDTGEIVGERRVVQTIFEIPAGQFGIFNFEFVFIACGNYEFNIEIDPDGNLTETTTTDNNYSETQENFGFCF